MRATKPFFRGQMAPRVGRFVAHRPRLRDQPRRMGRREPTRWLFLSLAKPQPRIRTRRRIPDPSARAGNRRLHRSPQGPALPRLPFLLHGARTDSDHSDSLEKIPRQGRASRPGRRTLPLRPPAQRMRQVQDCPIYAGMIELMDDAIGTVLAKLDEHGLDQNTIVCFTSDNGGVSSGDAYATSNLPSAEARDASGKVAFANPSTSRHPASPNPVQPAPHRSAESIGTPPCSISAASNRPRNRWWTGSAWFPC